MPTLRDCIKRHGKLISPTDAKRLLDAHEQAVTDGYDATKAAHSALDSFTDEISEHLRAVASASEKIRPTKQKTASRAPVATETPAAPTQDAAEEQQPIQSAEPPAPEKATGVKNASVAEMRKELGLPEAEARQGMKTADAHAQALAIVKADPQAGARLADELARTGRAATGVEDLVLAHELTRIRNERGAAESEFDRATKAGDPVAIAAAQSRIEDARAQFQKVGAVADATGTKQSDALRLRGAMLKEDFSIANLERRISRAKGNEPTTPEDAALAKKTHENYERTIKTLNEKLAASERARAEDSINNSLNKLFLDFNRDAGTPKARKPAMAALVDRGEQARQRIAQRRAAGAQFSTSGESGVDSMAPRTFTFRDVNAGELPVGVRDALREGELGVNNVRRRQGKNDVTLHAVEPEDLAGGATEHAGSIHGEGVSGTEGRPGVSGEGEANRREAQARGVATRRRLELVFKKRITFFRASEPIDQGALTSPSRANQIFVNADTPQPLLAMVGHEFTHNLKAQAPHLYNEMVRVIDQHHPILERYKSVKRAQLYTEAQLHDEWVADLVGERFTEPAFWREAAKVAEQRGQMPAFKRLAQAAIDWISKVIIRVKNVMHDLVAAHNVDELEKVRTKIAETMHDYAANTPEGGYPDNPGLSRGVTDASMVAPLRRETQFSTAPKRGLTDDETKDYAQVVAGHLANGVTDAGKLSARMTKDFGPEIAPHLPQIILAGIEEHARSAKAAAVGGRDVAGERADTVAAMQARAASGESVADMGGHVRDLIEQHRAEGVKRAGMADAVHKTLQEVQPGISRTDTAAAVEDAERTSRAVRQLDGQINQLNAQLRTETVFGAGKPRPLSTADVVAKRAELNRLKEWRDFMRERIQPRDFDAEANAKAKARFGKATAILKDKLAREDFSKPERIKRLSVDPEVERARAENERTKQDFANEVFQREQAQRPRWEKVLEQISGGARASALSGYHTLIKLASYSATKFAGIPVTEMTANALSKVPGLRRTFAASPHEGGATAGTLGTLYHSAATKGLSEAARVMRTGKTDAKATYGKQKPEAQHWYDFFGKLHGAEKAPLITGVHEMLVKKATAKAAAAGVDVNDPLVKGAIRKDAFDYANRSILQENNKFADWINEGLRKMRAVDKETGKASGVKSVIATALETLLTKGIVKTPANYFMQSLEASPLGFAVGAGKQAVALRRGVENLKPKEADTIARLLSVGAVGSALFALGAIDATKKEKDRMFGGYYQPGDKRKPNDVGFGAIRIGDVHLPHLVTHNPFTESAQMGSTFMRVMLSKLKKTDVENRGALAGAISSIMGLAEGAPVENQLMRLNKAAEPNQQVNVVGGIVRGLVPQLVQNIADDTDDKKRAPTTVLQNVEMAVPGLRQQVPAAKPKK